MPLADRINLIIQHMPGKDRGKKSILAKIANCERSAVHHWLTGQPKINYRNALAISEHFGYSLTWLMDDTGPMKLDSQNDVLPCTFDAKNSPLTSEKQLPARGGELFLAYVNANEMRILTSYRERPEYQPVFDNIARVMVENP